MYVSNEEGKKHQWPELQQSEIVKSKEENSFLHEPKKGNITTYSPGDWLNWTGGEWGQK